MSDELERLRELSMRLPEAAEKISHGGPSWFVRKRMFGSYAGLHHNNRLQFWCAAPPGVQEELIDDTRYFRPPYVGHRGWVGIYLDVPLDWVEVAEIIQDAYRCVAPKTLVSRAGSWLRKSADPGFCWQGADPSLVPGCTWADRQRRQQEAGPVNYVMNFRRGTLVAELPQR